MSAGKPKRGRFARRSRGPRPTEAGRRRAPGTNRVRARLGKGINTVRDLVTAGARACEAGKRHKHGARLARRSRGIIRTMQKGFLRAPANRSRAWARTRKQPRACETRERKRHGARLAHRRCACVRGREKAQTRCASCSPQVRVRARLGKGTNTVRDLPGAAARLAHRRCSIKNYARRLSESLGQQKPGAGPHPETTACVRGWEKTQTGCVMCPAQPRVLLTAGARACETRGRKRHGA